MIAFWERVADGDVERRAVLEGDGEAEGDLEPLGDGEALRVRRPLALPLGVIDGEGVRLVDLLPVALANGVELTLGEPELIVERVVSEDRETLGDREHVDETEIVCDGRELCEVLLVALLLVDAVPATTETVALEPSDVESKLDKVTALLVEALALTTDVHVTETVP